MAVSILVVVLGLAVGLGVGLTQTHSHHSSTTATALSTPTSSPFNDTSSGKVWQPPSGTTWNIQLLKPLMTSPSKGTFDVWDIDLFDNPQDTISSLKNQSAKVICYFSAGSAEDWRSDYSSFAPSDLGKGLDGWEGERWLNLSSPNVRQIMVKRLDLARSKGCDGVDPDNVDGYDNDNGLGLTQQDSIDYMQFLSSEAHQRGMAIGLKNAGDLISSLIGSMQWSVNEQCVQYDECDTFTPFIDQDKPVFHVEYPKGDKTNNNDTVPAATKDKICKDSSAAGFSTIIKNIDLDSWIESC